MRPTQAPTEGGAAGFEPPPNDECFLQTPISGDGPFYYNTLLATTDGDPHLRCCSFGTADIFADVWYCWTAGCTGDVWVETCGQTDVDTKIAVYDGCACPATDARLLGCDDDSCGLQTRTRFTAVAGEQYLIRVGIYPGDFGGEGTFTIAPCVEECELPPPPGAFREDQAEPTCGVPQDTTNGGCNSSPPVFTPIGLGALIYGDAAFDCLFRDTDWYRLVLGQTTDVRLTVTSDFATTFGIVDNNGVDSCVGVVALRSLSTVYTCQTYSYVDRLGPGVWWVYVAPTARIGLPCEAHYVLRVDSALPLGACCLGGSSCEQLSQSVCTTQGGTYLGNGAACTSDTTFVRNANRPIPDGGTATDLLFIAPTGDDVIQPGTLRIGLLIEHAWQGDLRIELIHPGGMSRLLVDRPGEPPGFGFSANNYGSMATNTEMVFADGFPPYDDGSPGAPSSNPIGVWGPLQPLSALEGLSRAGTWRLRVTDLALPDAGRIVRWRVILTGPTKCASCDGPAQQRGNTNCDPAGLVNNFDIDCFVTAIAGGETSWTILCNQNHTCDFACVNDINGDSLVNNLDIDPFLDCLIGGCP
ncbi:MAG: proprotein convertase P-domain-containing protein [Phycisphaerales bacterium]|nr:proprotein convertase P-domain-containing protein [Phycisphaerales bacterium]